MEKLGYLIGGIITALIVRVAVGDPLTLLAYIVIVALWPVVLAVWVGKYGLDILINFRI